MREEKGGEIQQHSKKPRGITGNLYLEINKAKGREKKKPQRLQTGLRGVKREKKDIYGM